MPTARSYDTNGWPEIKDNPISKAGVFPYKGSMIDPNGEMGLDPEAIYQVYRSAEELSKPETLESFKLLPWVDDHLMLGDGFEPAESKGIQGVTGEEVHFSDGYLRANLKLFSDEHTQKVEDGKRELSCGYRCEYELREGIFGDQKYSVAQTNIRGNHLASVDEGRMGPDVSVLDHHLTFAVDTKDFEIMPKPEKTLENFATDSAKPDEFGLAIQMITTKLLAMDAADPDDTKGADEDDPDDKGEDRGSHEGEDQDDPDDKGEDQDDDKKGEDQDDDEKGEDGDDPLHAKGEDTTAMDAITTELRGLKKTVREQGRTGMKKVMRQIRDRDALYAKVSPTIGAFDHAEMDADELAVYACDKLGLKVRKGHESTAIDAYFQNRAAPTVFANDSMFIGNGLGKSSAVDKYFDPQAS